MAFVRNVRERVLNTGSTEELKTLSFEPPLDFKEKDDLQKALKGLKLTRVDLPEGKYGYGIPKDDLGEKPDEIEAFFCDIVYNGVPKAIGGITHIDGQPVQPVEPFPEESFTDPTSHYK